MGSYRSQSIYQLHIQLEEIEPAIWRRIIVPGKISLARLHRLLQPAMGWENYHLHLFTIGGVRYGEPDPEYADEGFQVKHDRYASVRDVLRTEGMRFRYDYDFGDDWRHDVLVERIEVLDAEDWVVPRCLDGRRACPPEDCGGFSGYEALLEALLVIVTHIWQKLSSVERDVTLIVKHFWQLFSRIFGETSLIVTHIWRNRFCFPYFDYIVYCRLRPLR